MDMSVLLSCLISAGKGADPPIHSTYLYCVDEVGKLTGLKSKKSMGPDDIPARLLKPALPYIVEPLTYIYNLCIQKCLPKNVQNSQSTSPEEH